MKQIRCLAVLGLAAIVLGGCVRSPVSLSSSTIPLGQRPYTKVSKVEAGVTSTTFLFVLPFGSGTPARDAVDEAITRSGCDALINVSVDSRTFFFLLGWSTRTTVQGTGVNFLENSQVRQDTQGGNITVIK